MLIGEQTPAGLAPPASLLRALLDQTDLRLLPEEDGVLVWANADWVRADGDGLITSPRASSDPGLRGLGVAAGLVAVGACITEGTLRRRRAPKRRLRNGSPSEGDGGPKSAGAKHEHEAEAGAALDEAPAAEVDAESPGQVGHEPPVGTSAVEGGRVDNGIDEVEGASVAVPAEAAEP